jgi:hypothetical protein
MDSSSTTPPPRTPASAAVQQRKISRGNRSLLLAAALAVVLLSLTLSLGPQQHQVLLPLIRQPLPPLCAWKNYTGLDCPGCGLTRSFIAVGHGRWREAWEFNPAGPLWYALIAAQIPWQLLQLWRLRRGLSEVSVGWSGHLLLWLGFTALILQWVVRQFGGM